MEVSHHREGADASKLGAWWRMPDSQPKKSGFESPLALFRSLAIYVLSTTIQFTQLFTRVPDCGPCWNVSEYYSCSNCSMAECLEYKSGVCRNEQVCQGVRGLVNKK